MEQNFLYEKLFLTALLAVGSYGLATAGEYYRQGTAILSDNGNGTCFLDCPGQGICYKADDDCMSPGCRIVIYYGGLILDAEICSAEDPQLPPNPGPPQIEPSLPSQLTIYSQWFLY